MQLKLRLTLRSDYHTGSGAGIGSQVDSALLRDRDAVPVLRGSTLAGLLRDGLRRLLQTTPVLEASFAAHLTAEEARDDGGAAAYCTGAVVCPLCQIFGSPAAPKRWRVSSARPAGASTPFAGDIWRIGRTGAQVAARVRINPRDRRAHARHLFKQEEGDRRLQFDFTVACDDDDEAARDEAALIFAAARMVRRFGSARRRGRGECFILALDSHGQPNAEAADLWLEHFRRAWLNGERAAIERHAPAWRPRTEGDGDAVRVRVILRSDEPLVAARRAAAGNIFDCLDHINASTFWGALAARAAAQWQLRVREDERDAQFYEDDYRHDGAYRAFVELLLRGAVRVTPFYPASLLPGDGTDFLYPMIPTPLDVLTCKAYPGFRRPGAPVVEHGAEGFAAADEIRESCGAPLGASVDGEREKCPMPLERLGGFVQLRSYPPHDEGAARRDEMHPRINPVTQRVATGDLFGYEALDSGQFYIGEIWCRNRVAWESLGELAALPADGEVLRLRLGKATRRGYGAVAVWFESGASVVEAWRGNLPLEQRVTDANAPLTLTLLTAAIVPDAWGRFHQSFTRELLADTIGAGFEITGLKEVFAAADFVDTFNNHLGLPRWRDRALRAGSAVGFTRAPGADLPTLQARLKEIEAAGIGLRRHEGFGQVVFNHPLYVAGGAGMKDTAVAVPDALRLARQSKTGTMAATVESEDAALDRWLVELREEFPKGLFTQDGEKGRERWAAVARWLHDNASDPTEQLLTRLKDFGKPSLLINIQRDEPRDKENYFATKGRAAIERLGEFLRRASESAPSNEARRRMIETLADYLSITSR